MRLRGSRLCQYQRGKIANYWVSSRLQRLTNQNNVIRIRIDPVSAQFNLQHTVTLPSLNINAIWTSTLFTIFPAQALFVARHSTRMFYIKCSLYFDWWHSRNMCTAFDRDPIGLRRCWPAPFSSITWGFRALTLLHYPEQAFEFLLPSTISDCIPYAFNSISRNYKLFHFVSMFTVNSRRYIHVRKFQHY